MTNPTHSNDIRENRKAIAPYNFVPLPESVRLVENPPSQGFYDKSLLTGKITCILTNSTPIYLRAAQTLKEFEKKESSSEPFYHGSPQEKLLIPGSSIRGMLRTLVEVISQARLSPVTDKQLFYRSVENTSMGSAYTERMKDKVRAGFFHRDKSRSWIVPTIAARVERVDIQAQFSVESLYKEQMRNGELVKTSPRRVPREEIQHQPVFVRLNEQAVDNPTRFYTAEEFSRQKLDGFEDAVLVITGDMNGKEKEFAFLKRGIDSKLFLTDEQVDLFEDKDQLTQYQGFAFPKTKGRKADGKLKDGDPVFYLASDDEKQVLGFGRAYMFRLPYQLSPAQMLSEILLGNPERYDLAEALFGYIPQSNVGRKQVTGRVAITDAVMIGDDIQNALLPQTRLNVLSSPKATAFQHYLTQENPNDPDTLSIYDTSKEKTTLRGHKFYWHKGAIERSAFEASGQIFQNHDNQYSPPVKPIRENQKFEFAIHFENLRPEELGAVLWVLDKGNDNRFRLKIGMGKPYGLGSVAIAATPNLEDRIQRYEKLFLDKKWFVSSDPHSDQKLNNARVAFARWLLKNQDATLEQVDENKRIQELLIMLSWVDHPSVSITRYMELKEFAGKKGGFTKRSVLPAPHIVFGKWLKEPAPKIYNPVSVHPHQLNLGDVLLATVLGNQDDDVVLHCQYHDTYDYCIVSPVNRRPKDRVLDIKGTKVLLEVIGKSQENDEWIIDCRVVDQ